MMIQGLRSSACSKTCNSFTQIVELAPCAKLGNAIIQVTTLLLIQITSCAEMSLVKTICQNEPQDYNS